MCRTGCCEAASEQEELEMVALTAPAASRVLASSGSVLVLVLAQA